MLDRVATNPHRYKLTEVDVPNLIYDLEFAGDVTTAGTPLSKATLLSDETAVGFGLVGSTATIDDVLKTILSFPSMYTSSYVLFCSTVDSSSLDCAFGRNNEDIMRAIGMQLAMYAWFSGDSKTTFPFTNLQTKQTLDDVLSDTASRIELFSSTKLITLLSHSQYALVKMFEKDYCLKDIILNETTSNVFALSSIVNPKPTGSAYLKGIIANTLSTSSLFTETNITLTDSTSINETCIVLLDQMTNLSAYDYQFYIPDYAHSIQHLSNPDSGGSVMYNGIAFNKMIFDRHGGSVSFNIKKYKLT